MTDEKPAAFAVTLDEVAASLTGLDVEVRDGDRTFFTTLADPREVAGAVVADAASPAAGDFDDAAEVTRLRATVTELLGEFGSTGRGWNVARISDEHLARLRARLAGQ